MAIGRCFCRQKKGDVAAAQWCQVPPIAAPSFQNRRVRSETIAVIASNRASAAISDSDNVGIVSWPFAAYATALLARVAVVAGRRLASDIDLPGRPNQSGTLQEILWPCGNAGDRERRDRRIGRTAAPLHALAVPPTTEQVTLAAGWPPTLVQVTVPVTLVPMG